MEPNKSDSAVDDGASTSAETSGAAETTAAPEPQTSPLQDPWDKFGSEEAGAEEVKTEEEAAAGETAAPEPPKSEKPDAEKEPASETTSDDEDQVLEELFADGDKPAEADKAKAEEKPKEEDLDAQDPSEMIAGQRNKTAASYLQRMEKYATPLKDLRKGSIEPLETLRRLEPVLGPEVVQSLKQAAAHDLVDKLPDQTFKRAFAIKKLAADPSWDPNTGDYPNLDDLVKGVVTTAAPATSDVDLSSLTKDIDGLVSWDWRDESLDDNFVDDRERTLAGAARRLEAKAKEAEAARTQAETQLTELKSTQTTQAQTEGQQAAYDALMGRINTFRGDIQGKFLPYAFKNAGLAVDANDTPEVAAFKQRRQELYQGTDYERTNNLPSRFENFVENESSVKGRIEDVYTRIVDAQKSYVEAEAKGDKAGMAAAVQAAEDERVPLFTLLRDAHKEFKEKYIAPEMELFAGKAAPRQDPKPPPSRPRPEVVSNQGTAKSAPITRPYRDADDVWNDMLDKAREDDALAAAG